MSADQAAYIQPAPHEAAGHLIFTSAGLSPYYGLHAVTKGADYGEPVTGTFRRDGEQWTASLKPKTSGLKPRDDPSYDFETAKEFSLRVEPTDADERVAAPAVSFTVSPRWPDLESKGDSPNPSNPDDLEGIDVGFNGSNLPIDKYPELLRRGMSAVDINPGYFATIHENSNIYRCEHYVRVDRERAKKVIGDEGPIRRIFEHVESHSKDRELKENDGKTVGYHHRVKFDSPGAAALFDGHTLGKQIKHYHPKFVHGDADNPLAHPKIGVCYLSNLTDDNSVPWDDRDELDREVDETLVNVLGWAGLSVRADTKTYVSDIHFSGEETTRDLTRIDDPLPEIKRDQDAAVVSALSGTGTGNPDLNQSDTEALRVMADGGERQDVHSIAEAIGTSTRTVYRVIDRLSDILTVDNGTVGFASDYLRSKTRYALQCATDALKSATKDSEGSSAWAKWVDAYGPEVGERFPGSELDRIDLSLGEIPPEADVKEILEDGLRAWVRSGRDPMDFRGGSLSFRQNGQVLSTPATSNIGNEYLTDRLACELDLKSTRSESPISDVFAPT